MKIILEESVEIKLSGSNYLLEEGDIILLEAPVRRKYLKVESKDETRYFVSPSASDNYIIKFVNKLCNNHLKCKNKVSVAYKLPDKVKARSIEYYINELTPED